jgi:hypothetical protein
VVLAAIQFSFEVETQYDFAERGHESMRNLTGKGYRETGSGVSDRVWKRPVFVSRPHYLSAIAAPNLGADILGID